MEQKKILWIVAAVSVFVLVIFGFALVIYSPSNNTETERQTAAAFTPGTAVSQARQNVINGETASRVDPDSWARNPENTPGLDTEIVAAGSAGNLTDLNAAYGGNRTETTQENPETINVRSLTARAPQQKEPASGTAQAEPAKPEPVRTAQAEPAKPAKPAEVQAQRTPKEEDPPAKRPAVEYWIQTGSFSDKLNAENARRMLTERYLNAEIFTKDMNGAQTYRVRVGPYTDKEEADYWLGTIAETPEFSGSYVSRVTARR